MTILVDSCRFLSAVPLSYSPAWGRTLATRISATAERYFRIEVKGAEGIEAYHSQRLKSNAAGSVGDETSPSPPPYVIAVSPHNVLPISFVAFSPGGPVMRRLGAAVPSIGSARGVASSAVFYVPLMRNLWSWLGLTAASRAHMRALLSADQSVIVCPGGVREALYMDPRVETLFLRRRRGFVRLAMERGAPIVPCFAFGQRAAFRWWRPPSSPSLSAFARAIGYVPMLFWGMGCSPLPYPAKMTIVLGEPLTTTPPAPASEISDEEVDTTLRVYIAAIEELFERHKADAGYPDLELRVL